MTYYELFQQEPVIYVLVLVFSLVITIVAYGAVPFIIAKTRKNPITKKKYRRLCYGINVAVMFLFIVVNGGASNGAPYFLWTWVFSSWGMRMLEGKGLLDDGTYAPSVSTHETEQSRPAIEMDKVRFCRKCGEELMEDSNFCRKCGTEVVKESQS